MSKTILDRDLSFFVIVKSHNHRQDDTGRRTLLNYHFFGEIFIEPGRSLRSARLYREGIEQDARPFRPHGDDVLGDNAWYLEGGWYPDEQSVNAIFPNGRYVVDIETPNGKIRGAALRLEGASGATEIPDAPIITLSQNGKSVSPNRLDPELDLVVTWGGYELGQPDPRGIVDDLVFVVVADCFGNRIVKSGLCFEDEFLTYRDTSYTIPAGTLLPGRPHSMFVELPHVSDSLYVQGVPGFACFASATYLDIRTLGAMEGPPCPERRPALDTGETDRLEPSRREDRSAL